MIFVDIETLPDITVPTGDRAIQEHPKLKSVPSNWKDPGKIAAKEAEIEKERALFYIANPPDDSAWRKGALDPWSGFILSVAIGVLDGETQVFRAIYSEEMTPEDAAKEERILLHEVTQHLEELSNTFLHKQAIADAWQDNWVTFNGEAFDLPWLWLHATKHGIDRLRKAVPFRKFSKRSTDLVSVLKGTNYRGGWITQSRAAAFFGIEEPATGITGATVCQAWMDGRIGEICIYNAGDVDTLKALWLKTR